ncbi:Cytochrome P450 [Sphingomonas sp. YR710]|jgi:cytochrome P450|uniref:cytochrome P450 n=1 Tax=Sphingomonas sp. YR710 TaxID=1882773 RepID=UPI000890B1A8|nr:cytochrome P450 [Sphingomonas sp. YR710]SDC42365.1 Cytochrome P450 [Sphingomonas sp. YR710]
MISAQQGAVQMPFPRDGVLKISPLYAKLREQAPIIPVTTPTGDPAWVVVAFDEAKQVFADRRFGYYTHHDPKNASRMSEAALHAHPLGGMDFEDQMVRLRKLMAPGFTPRRLALLKDWVQDLTNGCLDEMQAAHDRNPGEPVDFHELLGFRLPVLVIAALLGFPVEDADYVTALSHRMGGTQNGADAMAAARELQEYMRGLIAKKRENLGPDVLSDFIRAQDDDPSFFASRSLESFAAGLVFPGHETTVVRMDFGVLYLLSQPERRDWLMADPEGRIDQVVEEVLRITSAHNFGLMRYANEDIDDIGGVTIRRGDLVIISESAANRDPRMFERPEEFDPTRKNSGHLSFGHGAHNCLGMSLARMELKAVFLSLFRRFPQVRLAADPAEMEVNNSRVGGGVDHVPLIW